MWLLERRDREIAALSKASLHAGGGGSGGVLDPLTRIAAGRIQSEIGGGGGGGGDEVEMGRAAAMQYPLLEGLRPECEAVMRALFCRVDR